MPKRWEKNTVFHVPVEVTSYKPRGSYNKQRKPFELLIRKLGLQKLTFEAVDYHQFIEVIDFSIPYKVVCRCTNAETSKNIREKITPQIQMINQALPHKRDLTVNNHSLTEKLSCIEIKFPTLWQNLDKQAEIEIKKCILYLLMAGSDNADAYRSLDEKQITAISKPRFGGVINFTQDFDSYRFYQNQNLNGKEYGLTIICKMRDVQHPPCQNSYDEDFNRELTARLAMIKAIDAKAAAIFFYVNKENNELNIIIPPLPLIEQKRFLYELLNMSDKEMEHMDVNIFNKMQPSLSADQSATDKEVVDLTSDDVVNQTDDFNRNYASNGLFRVHQQDEIEILQSTNNNNNFSLTNGDEGAWQHLYRGIDESEILQQPYQEVDKVEPEVTKRPRFE